MKKLPYDILKILANGEFHSGESLGKQFDLTRSGVWKVIKQLTKLGIDIQSVKGRGYQIPGGIELLEKKLIEKNLAGSIKNKISKLEIFSTIDSTNQYLLQQAQNECQSGWVCLAEHQSNGRGRHGRYWHSPFGSNLYLSLLWHFATDPAEISGLSLAIAIAVVRALKKYGITEQLQLKWPNDIKWQEKKLAGILLELMASSHERSDVIIGIGLNLNIPEDQTKHITQPWTDLQKITGQPIKRNHLVSLILNEVINSIIEFEQAKLIPFLPEWQHLDCFYQQEIELKTMNGIVKGIANGITEKGELILLGQNNQVHKYLSGEVSFSPSN